jgi:hypothetical protein
LQALSHHEYKRVVARYVGWGNVLAFNEGRPTIKVLRARKINKGREHGREDGSRWRRG